MPEIVVALSDWQVQLLRFTAFLHSPLEDPATVWRDATGADPEIDENRVKDGLRRQIGSFGGASLETQVTAARIDILLTPPPPASGAPSALAEMLPAEGALTTFKAIVHRWLNRKPPPSVRLAFGASFMHETADHAAAYRQLFKLLKAVRVEPEHMRELVYRVNRPTQSRVDASVTLNRITMWNSVVLRMLATNMPAVPTSQAVTLVERQFVRLEVDDNTPAERTTPLDGAQLIPIFDELVSLGVANAELGECP